MLDQQRSPRLHYYSSLPLICWSVVTSCSQTTRRPSRSGPPYLKLFKFWPSTTSRCWLSPEELRHTNTLSPMTDWSTVPQGSNIKICSFCVSERRVNFRLFTHYCCWGSWYYTIYCCISGTVVCLLVCSGGSQVCLVLYFSSVIQVFQSLWDTCVAISGVFPLLFLRTFRPLGVIVYICSSGFFSLGLLLSLSLPVYWIFVLPFAVVRLHALLLLILSSKCPETITVFFCHQRRCEEKEGDKYVLSLLCRLFFSISVRCSSSERLKMQIDSDDLSWWRVRAQGQVTKKRN